MISFVSAFDFDNTYEYYEETNTAIIHNCDFWLGVCLNEGEILANVTRTSPHNKKVPRGLDTLVGEFNLTTTGDFTDIFGEMYLTDMRNGNEISRGKQYKYKKYTNVSVDDYGWTDCENITDANGTRENCTWSEIGSHFEIQMDWIPIGNPTNTFYAGVIYEIGVFVDVEQGDWGDWRPSILGIEIIEWSQWTESLNAGLNAYYKLDEGSGTVIDSLGLYNMTNSGASNSSGIINSSYVFDTPNTDYIDGSSSPSITGDWAISTWVYRNGANNDGFGNIAEIGSVSGSNGFGIWSNQTGGLTIRINTDYNHYPDYSGNFINTGAWYHIVGTYNGSQTCIYINNISVGCRSFSTDPTADTSEIRIGNREAHNAMWNGKIDETAFYNRTLQRGEITQLYNGGSGISWTDTFGVAPLVTLVSPADNANLTSGNVDFIATVTDDLQVTNVTLYLDGVANETNSSGFNGTYTFSKVVSEGVHNWSILAYDNESLSNQSETREFNYTQPPIFIDLISPADASTHDTPTVNMTCRAYKDEGVTQLNLTINGVVNISVVNTTVAENLTISQNINFSEGNYTWGCSALNPSTSAVSSNRTFQVLYSSPVINLFSPANDSTILIENVTFLFSATNGNGIDNVTLYIDGVANETNSSGVQGNYSFFRTLADGIYNWSVTAISIYGKVTNSTLRIFTLHTETPSVEISAPSGIVDYLVLGNNETLTYNISEGSEDPGEHFDECWYIYPSPQAGLENNKSCYQETANISTACGGLNTGGYYWEPAIEWQDKENMIDTDWSTYGYYGLAFGDQFFYINYTIPIRTKNATWKYKFDRVGGASLSYYTCLNSTSNWIQSTNLDTGAGAFNGSIDISNDCMINNTLQIRLQLEDSERFYEEAIDWGYSTNLNCSENQANFTYVNGQNNLTVYAKDEFGFIASNTTNWNYAFLETNRIFSTTALQTSTETFKLIGTKDSSVTSVSAVLTYNGVNYTSVKTGTGNNVNLTSSVEIPIITGNASFFWTVTYINSTGTYSFITGNSTQEVIELSLEECFSPSIDGLTLNFTTYDTTNLTALNSSLEATFQIYAESGSGSLVVEYLFSDLNENRSNYMFCLNSSGNNVTLDAFISYTATDYDRREYIIDDGIIGNFTQSIPLYLAQTTLTDIVTITVQDQSYDPIAGALVAVQIWNVGTNTYSTIGMLTTSSAGQGIIDLVLYTTWYRAVVYIDGIATHVEDVQKLASTSWIITVETGEDNPYDLFGSIAHGLTFDNSTNITSFTWIDTSGYTNRGCLVVKNSTTLGQVTIFDSCVSSVSGTIDYLIVGNGDYTAYGIIFLEGYDVSQIVDELAIRLGTPELTQTVSPFGKVISFISIGTAGLIGVSAGSTILGGVLIIAVLIGLMRMGFLNITWGFVWGIISIIILVWILQRRKR